MNWTIPNLDPYVAYVVNEITRWIAENQRTIGYVTGAAASLKVWAIRSGRAKDDKIWTLLWSFISLKWPAWLTRKLKVGPE